MKEDKLTITLKLQALLSIFFIASYFGLTVGLSKRYLELRSIELFVLFFLLGSVSVACYYNSMMISIQTLVLKKAIERGPVKNG